MYSCIIADILESFAGVEEAIVMGDVSFGACCVDDYSASALDADFLVHYGHSCLVPVDVTGVPCMYVFVDIKADSDHLVACVRETFPPGTRLALAGTIQFASAVQAAKRELAAGGDYPLAMVPQARPLSPGEVLGCTAPRLPLGSCDAAVFVADGRFHLEALMIANPWLPAYRYDPYGRVLTLESYDHAGMKAARRAAVEAARAAPRWGLVLGTLGRQGNPRVLAALKELLDKAGRTHVTVLMSEVSPARLAALSSQHSGVGAWVQVACPRLSIDWGDEFALPTLNPYEAFVALGSAPEWWKEEEEGGIEVGGYAMDYYSSEGGDWSGSYHRGGGGKGSAVAALSHIRAEKRAIAAARQAAAAPS
jgi:2-(3-amino-3-carboxypropyl)histidine synthase